MTEKEMKQLANYIADAIMKKQAEYDAEFMKHMEIQIKGNNHYFAKDEENLIILEQELQKALDNEDYELAAKITDQIKKHKPNTNND